MSHITPAELALWQRGGLVHRLLDVRRATARQSDGGQIAGGQWRDPARWLDWKDSIPTDGLVVLYCVHGHEISQGLVAVLRVMGCDARYLVGGIEAWRAAGEAVLPVDA
ncbi:rhodanese-like domain-containing protein [Denitromonas halophila]|uniref:Sulfurtransferase n=1 Tax=Denitromonas halophila TaxID=1629404 RepID=A0A557QIC9_9RHOO|nr:rhodanese-like domain-containing protein [Denitromonas halophila]TVO52674.1 sulfurtransferase [Denitromonas halophila]